MAHSRSPQQPAAKEEKTVGERLKNFFGIGKKPEPAAATQTPQQRESQPQQPPAAVVPPAAVNGADASNADGKKQQPAAPTAATTPAAPKQPEPAVAVSPANNIYTAVQQRMLEEAAAKQKADEEAAKQLAERARKKAEEMGKKRAEEEAARLQAEAEAIRLTAEAEVKAASLQAEAEEAAKKKADQEAAEKKAEAVVAEAEAKKPNPARRLWSHLTQHRGAYIAGGVSFAAVGGIALAILLIANPFTGPFVIAGIVGASIVIAAGVGFASLLSYKPVKEFFQKSFAKKQKPAEGEEADANAANDKANTHAAVIGKVGRKVEANQDQSAAAENAAAPEADASADKQQPANNVANDAAAKAGEGHKPATAKARG